MKKANPVDTNAIGWALSAIGRYAKHLEVNWCKPSTDSRTRRRWERRIEALRDIIDGYMFDTYIPLRAATSHDEPQRPTAQDTGEGGTRGEP